MTRYKAGSATYPGDVTHMVGEVKGPTTFAQMVVATDATYDAATDTTRVQFSHLADDDQLQRDRFGTVRVEAAS